MAKRDNKKKRSSHSRLVRKHQDNPVVSPPAPAARKLAAGPAGHPTISACMIVKNEQEYLPKCLASIKELVDEIVIVDTGSTDNTVEIAKSFGARVYHHQWENDFSKARNISLGYATGDWILVIDADEELEPEDLPLLKKELYQTEHRLVAITVYNYSPRDAVYTSFLPSIRFFRRELGVCYYGIVHNQLRLPNNEEALRLPVRLKHYGYGLSAERMDQKLKRSTALLRQQLAENPDNGFAHFNLAQLLRGKEESPPPELMDEVILHAGRAIELADPYERGERHIHLMAIYQMVTSYHNKKEFDKAEEWCHRALALRPDFLDVLLNLGHIYGCTERHELARKYYLKYLDQRKNYDEHAETEHIILLHLHSQHTAYFGLGLVGEINKDYQVAVKWYTKCARVQESYLNVQHRLGKAYYHLGELEKAREHWNKQLALDPEHGDTLVLLGEVLHRTGEVDAARDQLLRALELGEQFSLAGYRLAIIARDRQQIDQALVYLDRLLAYDPRFVEGYRLRGDIHFDGGNYAAAASDYQRCLNDLTTDARLLNNLGNCFFHQENFTESEELYRRAAAADPEFSEPLRNWGMVLARLNRPDDACAALARYLEIFPADVETNGYLGDLYCRIDDLPAAIKCYERVVAAEPARAETWLRLADCYFTRGNIDSALLGYETVLKLVPGHQTTLARLQNMRESLKQMKSLKEAEIVARQKALS